MVKRFHAPGPWITRDLKECVLASDYDALEVNALREMALLQARLAEAKRDAARYRWLRMCHPARSDRVIHIRRNEYRGGEIIGCDFPSGDKTVTGVNDGR